MAHGQEFAAARGSLRCAGIVLIVLGLALGRWWRFCLALAAVAWPALLVATDVMGIEVSLLAASAVAVANVTVGILVNRVATSCWWSLQTAGNAA